jgi:hypothetical protein
MVGVVDVGVDVGVERGSELPTDGPPGTNYTPYRRLYRLLEIEPE